MILPINWLKDYCKTEKKYSEIADIFHSIGFTPDKTTKEYIDLEITPNRGDAVSVYGLSREINAFLNKPFTDYSKPSHFTKKKNSIISFDNEKAKESVPTYAYLVIEGPLPKKSPTYIAQRLKQININPKNNIVDLTNYLMHEYGQPLHAFDLEKINKLEIGFGKKGEKAVLLGDTEVSIAEENLIARSNNTIVDLVGISGCTNSAVCASTTKILMQAAIFTPSVIRKSAKVAGLQTPASYRYERGVDPNAPTYALEKAARILEGWGYNIVEKNIVVNCKNKEKTIPFDYALIPNLTGIKVDEKTSRSILTRLGFKVVKNKIIVPSWRTYDIQSPVDLVEEVIRIYGYHNIKPQALPSNPKQPQKSNQHNVNELITALAGMGLTEVKSTSFISKKEASIFGFDEKSLIEIEKPLSAEYVYMRPSLAPKMFEALSKNPWYDKFTIFEIGNIFKNGQEAVNIALATTNKNHCLEELLPLCDIVKISPEAKIAQLYKIKRPFFYAEAPIEKIAPALLANKIPTTHNKYKTISKFPPVVRDISFLVKDSTSIEVVSRDIATTEDAILIVEPLDEFESPKFEGKKSITLRITYQKINETLTTQHAETLHNRVREYLIKKYQASIRE